MKDLLIFFDNQTYKLNSIVVNYIKRWIVYKIINNYKKYDNIYLFKTQPEFVEKKITSQNIHQDIENILIWINNVIYKKYENYPTKCFKNIVDKINTLKNISYANIITKNNVWDEIIIFSSINNYNHDFTESNINYINNIVKNKKINLINISNVKFLKNMFLNINEEIIDINCLKTENIQINKMIGIIDIGEPININKYIDYDFTKNISCFEYLQLVYEIENILIQNLSSKKLIIDSNSIKILNDFLDKICINCVDDYNTQILNIFKSYKNSIKYLISIQTELLIDLPINKLSPELSASYIKYILEFYSIIYPKINYYNSLQNSVNVQKTKRKNIVKSTSEISIDNIQNFDLNDDDDISCKYLTSSLTITNWKEEYLNANPFGIIIKYNPNKFSYKGIYDINSSILKTYPNMIVNNITTNFVPLYDYYQIILFDYENENKNDDIKNDDDDIKNEKKIFNISKFNIADNINGNGNVMIPLYINKSHWKLTKSLWSYHMSFINNCFEPEYNIKMDNIYFYAIFKYLDDLKNPTNNKNRKSVIRLFCYLLRTCIQILIDNKFMCGVKNDYKKYFYQVLNLETVDKNSVVAEWIIRLIQLIISNGISNDELKIDLNKITTFMFKKYIDSNYKMDFWDKINEQNFTIIEKKYELKILKNHVIQNNICWLNLNFDICIFNNIIKSIYSINGFNQFIKQIDKTNGCLIDTNEFGVLNIKCLNDIIKTHCETYFDINNYAIDISSYCDEININDIII